MPDIVHLETIAERCGYHVLSSVGRVVTLDMDGQVQLLVAGMREWCERTGIAPATVVMDDGHDRWLLEVWLKKIVLDLYDKQRLRTPKRYVGIYPRRKRWCALIYVDGTQYYGGLFRTRQEAAWAHDELALRLLSQGAMPRYRLKLNYLQRNA